MPSLTAVVTSGAGQGAHFMALPWVRQSIRELIGFDPYPGTLNLRLTDPEARTTWRHLRLGSSLTLTPPEPESCGAKLFSVLVTPDIPAAVILPDLTRYEDDVLELIAATHLRTRLILHDDDRVTLQWTDHS